MNQQQTWHAQPISQIAAEIGVDSTRGLSREQAAERLRAGANRMPEPDREGIVMRLIRHLISPITLVLVLAAIATTILNHLTDTLVILTALAVNVVMGLIQEGRASRAFEALKESEARFAVVVRDGDPVQVAADEVVPGDIVLLATGNAIPADLRLIESHGLSVNEAALTGEWLAVEKDVAEVAAELPLAERRNMAYAGTLVAAGAGKGIVVATGAATELGAIATELGVRKEVTTPLMRDIKQVATFIVAAVAAVIIGIIVLGVLRGLPLEETLFTAIALAVASVPEGLPAAVTVVLALGMERILKKGGLVRNLLAAETLGTTSIILTDKTGTLTEGKMTLETFVTLSGQVARADTEEARALLRGAILASNGYVEEVSDGGAGELVVHGRPIEIAILQSGLAHDIAQNELASWHHRVDELHFDSSRRYGGMLVEEEGAYGAYITGAPETILELVDRVRGVDGTAVPLSAERRRTFEQTLHDAAQEGKRVIAAAYVPNELTAFPREEGLHTFLQGGMLLGLMIFSDVIREEAKTAIVEMHAAGARVLMLTGDNPETALSIGRAVGIASNDERAYTGAELAEMDDAALLATLEQHTIFARVAPADKLRIAQVLTAAGEVVAMTGDGVNDAPALNAASIGVAVGSGTDVAKEASDLVLLNNGFSVITFAIKEGRRLRDNFRKLFTYMLSTNFSEVALIGFALAFGLPLPILPTQILWSNLVEGGLMNFAFAFEPLYPDAMKRKPKDPENARVISPKLVQLITLVGCITSVTLVSVYLFLLFATDLALPEIQTLMFVAVSVNCIFMAFSMKSFGTPLWKLPILSNKFLILSLIASSVVLLAALYVPAIQVLVHVSPPTLLQVGMLVGFGIVNLVTIEIAKWLIFIHPRERAHGAAHA